MPRASTRCLQERQSRAAGSRRASAAFVNSLKQNFGFSRRGAFGSLRRSLLVVGRPILRGRDDEDLLFVAVLDPDRLLARRKDLVVHLAFLAHEGLEE